MPFPLIPFLAMLGGTAGLVLIGISQLGAGIIGMSPEQIPIVATGGSVDVPPQPPLIIPQPPKAVIVVPEVTTSIWVIISDIIEELTPLVLFILLAWFALNFLSSYKSKSQYQRPQRYPKGRY